MLRISSVMTIDGQRHFKVEGRLMGEFADELSRVAIEALADSDVKLDLADVTFMDHSGARVLRTLRNAGVELVNPSEFLLVLINGEQP